MTKQCQSSSEHRNKPHRHLDQSTQSIPYVRNGQLLSPNVPTSHSFVSVHWILVACLPLLPTVCFCIAATIPLRQLVSNALTLAPLNINSWQGCLAQLHPLAQILSSSVRPCQFVPCCFQYHPYGTGRVSYRFY